ncbi:hypothetical protein VNO78_14874 [Psophocarpus tetragonolobus]|uniref:Uncharacterized protein n=1 Tax=Psophocarpus tetragonolobus TaxID=3891 RepID=A0AAN9SDL6_PSOTE
MKTEKKWKKRSELETLKEDNRGRSNRVRQKDSRFDNRGSYSDVRLAEEKENCARRRGSLWFSHITLMRNIILMIQLHALKKMWLHGANSIDIYPYAKCPTSPSAVQHKIGDWLVLGRTCTGYLERGFFSGKFYSRAIPNSISIQYLFAVMVINMEIRQIRSRCGTL